MRRTHRFLISVCIAGVFVGCALSTSQAHIVLFNSTGRNIDVAVRLDGKLLFWGTAAVVQREPGMSFDLPVHLLPGTHHLVVQSGGQTAVTNFTARRLMTIEIRAKNEGIEVNVVPKRLIYI